MQKIIIMELLDILHRESENSHRVYLYEEEGRWYAYEHSAFLINDLLKDLVGIKQFIHEVYALVFHKVEVDLALLSGCLITSCSDTELIIAHLRIRNTDPSG